MAMAAMASIATQKRCLVACHDERQAIVELLGYEAVLEGFAVVLCSVYSVPFSRRCLMSFIHLFFAILWMFYIFCPCNAPKNDGRSVNDGI
jgi:hypothetical protein